MLAVFNVVEKPAEVAPGVVTARLTHRLSFAQNATRSQPRQCSGAGTPAQLPAPRCSVSFHRGPQERLHGTSLPRQKCTGLKVHFVRCGFGWDGRECIPDHWLRVRSFRLHRSGDSSPHWRGVCPVCGVDDALEVTDKGKTVAWNCFRNPACDHRALRVILRGLVICLLPASPRALRAARAPQADFADLLELSDCALRLRMACITWNLTPKEAAARLGMSRRTYYRAVSGVPDPARKPRAAP